MVCVSWLKSFRSAFPKLARRSVRKARRRAWPQFAGILETLETRAMLSGASPVIDLDPDNSSGATGANFKVTFTEGGAPVRIADTDATISDANNSNLSSMVIFISNLTNPGQEVLAANTTGTNITATYNANTGVLKLTGTDSVADYQSVLRNVTYSNSSDNPGTTARAIGVRVFDQSNAHDGDDDDDDGLEDGDLTVSNLAVTTVTIAAVNDAPVITVPTAPATDEDVPLTFSTLNANAIQIQDPDAGAIQVTVSVTNGTLSLFSTSGLSFSFNDSNGTGAGNGVNDSTMTFRGSKGAVNTALNGMTFTPAANFNGSSTLSISANDLGNSGSGGVKTDSANVAITVSAVNDDPVNSVPGAQTIAEGTARVFNTTNGNLISVSDLDAGSSLIQVSLSASNGRLSLSGTSGLSFVFSDVNGTGAGDGTADGSLTFRGTLSDVNAALAGLVFVPSAHFAGAATITLATNDLGQTGKGGPLTDTDAVTVNVTPDSVNDAPVNTVPGAQTIAEDTALVFSADMNRLISVADDSASSLIQVTVSATNGRLSLLGTSGLSFSFSDTNGTGVGDGTADATMTFRGTQAAINAALSELTFNPNLNFNGSALLTITTNDLGHTGSGGVKTDVDTVAITVTPDNDAPVNDLPASQVTDVDSSITLSSANSNLISITDVDADTGLVQVRLVATNGTVTLGSTAGLTFSFSDANGTGTGDGTGDSSPTFRGTLADVNAALNGLVYTPTPGFNGSASLAITTNDLGSTGAGGALTDSDMLTVFVNSTTINDGPENSVPGPQIVAEDTNLVFNSTLGNRITISDPDAGSSEVQVTLSATNGVMSLKTTSGLSFSFSDANGSAAGDGIADATMTFRGTVAAINTALNGFVFRPTANFVGNASVAITTNDLGNIGTGGAKTDTDAVSITVTAVNDAPVNHVPTTLQVTRNSRSLTFSTANGNAISVSDGDAGGGVIQVSLTAVNGLLTLASTSGLDFSFSDANGTGTGDGSLDTRLTFRGTISAVNAALQGLRFTPIRGAFASREGSITITTNDLGNTGGGPLLDTDVINITHNPVAFLARMHRLFNPNIDMHVFTTSEGEFMALKRIGLRDETTNTEGFDVADSAEDGASPLHRLYNPNTGEHYYTTSDGERDFLVIAGWNYEKDEGFVFAQPAPGTTELFLLYNNNSGTHLFTASVAEKDAILARFAGIWVQHTSVGFVFAVTASGAPVSSDQTLEQSAEPNSAMMSLAASSSLNVSTTVSTDSGAPAVAASGSAGSSTSLSDGQSASAGTATSSSTKVTQAPSLENVDELWQDIGRTLGSTGIDLLDPD